MAHVASVVGIDLCRQLWRRDEAAQRARRKVAGEVDIDRRIHRQAGEEHARRGGPDDVRVRLPRPRRLAQCPAGRAQHALRARRRRRVPPSRDVRAEVEEDEAVRRRETPLHQLHQRSKRACRASLERGIIASVS